MKSVRALIFATTLFLGSFFAYGVIPVQAQGIDRLTESQQGTYDYFGNQGTTVLDSTITSLQTVKTTADQSQTRATTSATLAKYITIMQATKAAYTTSFNQAKTENLLPARAQRQALIAATVKYQEEFGKLSVQEKQEPTAQAVIRVYLNNWSNLRTQAEEIDSGRITANSPGANSLNNATAISTAGTSVAGVVATNDTERCTNLTNFSITSCLDAVVTWFIKNTLLQIAGFLVWLSANMLNYAVQTGILDFASWAPQSLYPLWTVIRQIVSLVVVFAGLYLGFMYIIGREETFGRYVGWLAIFALFVNFSYPVTRALIDVSNVISLNIYASAVGTDPLTANLSAASPLSTQTSAGALIMDRLGLQGLVASATDIQKNQASFLGSLNSTPGALLAVAFVAYAAYIFFMATAIIAMRTFLLVALTVASPILLVDAVVPRLGEVAVKLRKIYFEQLIVAPIFMIMLALTLKFMEIFQTNGPIKTGAAAQQALQSAGGSGEAIQVFFGIAIMLIMLHVMLKVTKAAAGEAGTFATNMMGKVGGFGLGLASGGTGFLARGTIGTAAARMRDSGWMDKMQGSRMGRGLYGFSNSLAQSTYDLKNVGAVSRGMSAAGMGMGAGSARTYDKNLADKQTTFSKKLSSIQDGNARAGFIDQTKNGLTSKLTRIAPGFGKSDGDIITKKALDARAGKYQMYNSITDPAKKLAYYNENKADIDAHEQDKSRQAAQAAPMDTKAKPDTVKPAPAASQPETSTQSVGTPSKPRFQMNAEEIMEDNRRMKSSSQQSGATSQQPSAAQPTGARPQMNTTNEDTVARMLKEEQERSKASKDAFDRAAGIGKTEGRAKEEGAKISERFDKLRAGEPVEDILNQAPTRSSAKSKSFAAWSRQNKEKKRSADVIDVEARVIDQQ